MITRSSRNVPGEAGDNNYLPGSIVTAEGIQPLDLDRPGGLTLQTKVLDESGERVTLDQLHVASLRSAFPQTPIITTTEYFRRLPRVSEEVAAIALEELPAIFTRLVESDGTVRALGAGAASRTATYGILQLKDDPHVERGVLMPNEVAVVLGFVIEALTHGSLPQVHLSGPDFARYSQEEIFQERINQLYDVIRQRASFGSQLPETLDVQIVPAAEARFVAPLDDDDNLRALFVALDAIAAMQQERREFFHTHDAHSPDGQRYIAEARAREAPLLHEIGRLAIDMNHLFAGPRDAPFLSQYDLLRAGGIYAPEANASLPMNALRHIQRQVARRRAAYGKRG